MTEHEHEGHLILLVADDGLRGSGVEIKGAPNWQIADEPSDDIPVTAAMWRGELDGRTAEAWVTGCGFEPGHYRVVDSEELTVPLSEYRS